MNKDISVRYLLRPLRYLSNKGRIAVIAAVVAALLVIYFLPKSFSSVIGDVSVATLSISASEYSTDQEGNLQLKTYTLHEQMVDEDTLEEVVGILESTKYVTHPVSLITWLRNVEPEFADPTTILRLNLKIPGNDYLRVVYQSNADSAQTVFHLNQGDKVTWPMDQSVVDTLLAYVREHGSGG